MKISVCEKKKFWSKMKVEKFVKKRLPIICWLPHYTFSTLLHDLLAGLTVGVSEIPQAIAYALLAGLLNLPNGTTCEISLFLAGLPPEYGLYSGLVDGFIYAIFGTCKDLNIGPGSLLSLMLQPHVTKLGPDAAVLMTFLSGIIIFTLGVIRLGFVVEFLSYPIIAGFICGGTIQVGSSQIKSLMGISGKNSNFLECWISIVTNISETRLWDTVLGVVSILFLIVLKKIEVFGTLERRPDWSKTRNFLGQLLCFLSLARSAVTVVIGTILSYYLSANSPFQLTGTVIAGFPTVKPPPFSTKTNATEYDFADIAGSFGVSLFAIPALAILETVSVTKAFSKGQRIDATQELATLGLCNIVGSFVGSMPVNGSFSRSAINNASGVKTTLAGVFTSALLILTIAFLTPVFYYVPIATLASILIVAMLYLFDFKAFGLFWRTKKLDLIPFLTTFISTILLGADYGLLIGVAVNIIFVLYASARPKFDIDNEKLSNGQGNAVVITPKDTLYFPAAEYLRDTALDLEGDNITVIINGKYVRSIDITVAKSIAALSKEVALKKQKIVLLDFKQSVIRVCVGVDKTLNDFFFNQDDCEGETEQTTISSLP
ncbi:sodium-independent sulfate anion transporter-like isoform X4 [Tenebrio molitor]|uniref:sodium-independent sulfate anion transporter-like isoform X4 n=1 Tax=Tenebrio molitor TaxID=7067 RepID=UPI00362470C8